MRAITTGTTLLPHSSKTTSATTLLFFVSKRHTHLFWKQGRLNQTYLTKTECIMVFRCNCDRASLSSSLWLGGKLNIVCLRIPSWSSVFDYFAQRFSAICCKHQRWRSYLAIASRHAIANLVGCVSSGNRCISGIAIAKRLHENSLAQTASIPSNSCCKTTGQRNTKCKR